LKLIKLKLEARLDNLLMYMSFTDSGKPFNTLNAQDVDITLTADERKIGGLGIHLVAVWV